MKRGQAALEFLTTYGWAFLVIMVMIGALAYFGVLNPSALLPSRCTFGPEIQCLEHRISGSDLEFRFRNNVGYMANFTIDATEISKDITVSCDINGNGAGNPEQLKAGRIANVTCAFSSAFAKGDKIKFDIEAMYLRADGSYWTPVGGEVYGEAQ